MKKIYTLLAAFLCCTSLFAEEGTVANAKIHTIPGEVSALEFSAYNWIQNPNFGKSDENPDGIPNPEPVIEGDHLGFTQVGDRFDYKVNVSKAGEYWMKVYAVRGNEDNGGHFTLMVDKESVQENLLVVHEGGNWGNFTNFKQYKVTLPAGEHTLSILLTGEFNFQKLVFAQEKEIVTGPFGGKAATVPGIIWFGKYDEGAEGDVWGKASTGDDALLGTENHGGRHAREGSRIITNDNDYLGFTVPGEWAKHTIEARHAGTYKVLTYAATGKNDGETELLLNIDGKDYTLTATGSKNYDDYVPSNEVEVALTKGEHTLIWKVGDKDGNWKWIEFQAPADLTNTPYDLEKTAVPGEFSALLFDEGGEGIAYHDTSDAHEGGGKFRADEGVDTEGEDENGNIAFTSGGEWILYTIDVKEAGKYAVYLQMASGNKNGGKTAGVNFDKKDSDVRDINFILPNENCGEWSNYQYMKGNVEVELTAGKHVMKWMTDGDANLKTIKFTKTGPATGINSANTEDGAATYYNLRGVRVNNATNGVVIRVQNGKAVKVIK